MQSFPSYDTTVPALPGGSSAGNGGLNEKGRIRGEFTVFKFNSDAEAERWKQNHDDPTAQPFETLKVDNGFLNSGIGALWDLFIGATSVPFNAANSQIGIGDSTVSFAATQTDLQASTNKWYQAPDSGYPTRSGQTVTLQVTVASANANFPWNEFVWKNNAITPTAICLDRAVQSLGTKAVGTAWVLLFAAMIT